MNWVDWVLVALVALCTLHGLSTGAFRQTIILVRILLALLIATAVHVIWLPPSLVERGEALLPSGTLYALSLALLYILAWLALYLVFLLVRMLLTQQGELDLGQRLGGAFLGLVRGVALVFLAIILVDYTSLATHADWEASPLRQRLSPYAQDLRRGITQADGFTREHIEGLMRTWEEQSRLSTVQEPQ